MQNRIWHMHSVDCSLFTQLNFQALMTDRLLSQVLAFHSTYPYQNLIEQCWLLYRILWTSVMLALGSTVHNFFMHICMSMYVHAYTHILHIFILLRLWLSYVCGHWPLIDTTFVLCHYLICNKSFLFLFEGVYVYSY